MVAVSNLEKIYTDDAGPLPVLKQASFTMKKGEMVALIGESGAGKTTLLQILGGLEKYNSGSITIDGRELGAMSAHELSVFRGRRIGFVFQFHHLLPDFTALENTVLPGMTLGKRFADCFVRGKELLSVMGLDRRASHYPSELSGGERQRVALARALFNQPALILADEPTGNLDSQNSNHLMELFHKANEELGQTFLIATHSEQLARSLQRTIAIIDGKIIDR